MDKISVCMATFNGEKYIRQQLLSILVQLSSEDEVIISDDGSTDHTKVIIDTIADNRICFIENKSPKSLVRNFENAISKATGDFVFLSDQDDVWHPDKVRIMVAALEQVDLVVSDCYFIDETDQVVNESFYSAYRSGEGVLKNFLKNTYLGNCMAFKKVVLKNILPFPEELIRASEFHIYHDMWIGLMANIYYDVQFLPDKLSYFRRHFTNSSPTNSAAKSSNTIWRKVVGRWWLMRGFIRRAFFNYPST
ncbi:glycosyltransferase family 2 protein [Spirosoma areae]